VKVNGPISPYDKPTPGMLTWRGRDALYLYPATGAQQTAHAPTVSGHSGWPGPLWWELQPRGDDSCDSAHYGNDPSAGSPTETLLRLLLPLNEQV
jgi:hypothetical protein